MLFLVFRVLIIRQRKKIDITADTFRKMALEYPHVAESSHMDHPDFRVAGKIYATLGYPDENWGNEVNDECLLASFG